MNATPTRSVDDSLRDGLAAVTASILEAEALLRSRELQAPEQLGNGYIHLLGALQSTLHQALAMRFADAPRFVPYFTDYARGVWSNPDGHLTCANIEGGGAYRIYGNANDCEDLNFEVISGVAGYHETSSQISWIGKAAIDADANGHFEVFVGGEPRPRNWIPSAAHATHILARQTVGNWTLKPTPLLIDRLDTTPKVNWADGHDAGALLNDVAVALLERVKSTAAIRNNFAAAPTNIVPPPKVGAAGFLPGQAQCIFQFDLKPTEALVIEITPVPNAYRSIALGDSDWMETRDPKWVQGTLNETQSRISSDGVYRYVISAEDPKVHNWLSTGGAGRGLAIMRWQGLRGIVPVQPPAKVVDVASVSEHFPSDEPVIDESERAERLRLRRNALVRRFS